VQGDDDVRARGPGPRVRRALRDLRRIGAGADPAGEGLQLLLAGIVGLLTGVVAWALISGVHLVGSLAFSDPVPRWQLVVVPTLGGIVVGLLVARAVPEVSGGGVVATMEAMAIHRGRLRRRVPFAGVAATSIALGTGASGGREGPIVLFGGAVGSLIAQAGRLDEDRTRTMVAAGVAAGIAASFNAPIGGMLFAIELLLGGLRRAGSLQTIVVAAVVASVTARQLVGPGLPLFQPATSARLGAPSELLVHALLGLLALLVAAGFRHGELLAGRAFARLRTFGSSGARSSTLGVTLSVALGGLLVGLIALVVPEVLGEGADLPAVEGASREPIRMMLDGLLGTGWPAALALLTLLVAKLAASCISIGSGSAVGTLAPSLFTGAALGGAVGALAVPLLGLRSSTGFALVGMAAVFAAVVRAPLTAIILVFELTGDYELVLPLMLAVGIASFGADRLGWRSIYVEGLRRRGVTLARPDDVDVLQLVTVREVMTPADAPGSTVQAGVTVDELRRRFVEQGSHGAVVVDGQGRLVGVVTRTDVERHDHAAATGSSARREVRTGSGVPAPTTAGELATQRPVTALPDEAVFRAVQRMANLDVGRLPVIDPSSGRVVGVFRRADVVRAYDLGIERSVGTQLTAEAGRLRDVTGLEVVRLVVGAGSVADGTHVRDVRWPERTILTGVRRGSTALVPEGATRLAPEDLVVALTANPEELRMLLRTPPEPPAAPAASPPEDPS
jgi:chloride channel protein, CIC family